jgi:hypothetical protein
MISAREVTRCNQYGVQAARVDGIGMMCDVRHPMM